jgi:Sulfatase
MKLRTGLGYWGNGRGVATVRVVEDGKAPVVLAGRKVVGGTGAVWTEFTQSLDAYAGRIVGLELSSLESSGGGRVAFGEPAIVSDAVVTRASPSAKIVVIVIAAGLDRRMIPPWGPSAGLPALEKLVRDGVAFDGYRVPTTVVGPVLASLFTGLSPRAHGFEDATSGLREDARLIGERAKEESVHAGFFTGVPMSFPAFGFDRGWDRYETFSPIKDLPATEPLTSGAAWLKEQLAADRDNKLLLVVHARGGHPPWDVTRDEVALLPPEEYSGALEPRAGALVLANLRSLRQRGPVDQRLSGDDWRRLHALEETALKKQDAGLHRILETLEKEGLYDRALIVFAGDVAAGEPPTVPFAPVPSLREDVLLTPLIVKFPGGTFAGTQAGTMVSTTDVTKTILDALGVNAEGTEGTDLLGLGGGEVPIEGHPLVATLGAHYSTRWGPWLLTGNLGRRPTLCQLEVDPACATDAFAESPIAAAALWQRTYRTQILARATRGEAHANKGPDVLDADTQAALKVFGY